MELAATAGLMLDPWQQLFLDHALLERPDGTYAAFDVGLCVARQNGKGSIIEAIELADLFLLDTELCIHSAHIFETSVDAQRRLDELIESSPDLDRYFSSHKGKAWHAAGREGYELVRDGKKRRVKFKTRTKGGGRGLSGDRVMIDEAMYYTAEQDAALRPTMAARSVEGSPQIWQTGSAGNKDSTEFGRLRALAIKGRDPRMVWAEWSIDPHADDCPSSCDEHDEIYSVESYAKANPGLGIRISVDFVENERSKMDADMFACERLGVGDWPVEGDAWRVIDEDSWRDRVDGTSQPQSPLVFAIDTTPDLRWSCISVCGGNGEGMRHVEVTSKTDQMYDHRLGTRWVVPRVIELWKLWKPAAVVIDKASQASRFIDELEAAGVKILSPTGREYAQGCGVFHASVVPRRGNKPSLAHCDQPMLTNAVAGADKRDSGDMWVWDKRNASTDISPLVSCTLALWGYDKVTNKPKPKPRAAWG